MYFVRQLPRRQSNFPLLTATRSKWNPDVRRLLHWLRPTRPHHTLDGADALDTIAITLNEIEETPIYLNDEISENIKGGIAY